MHVLLKRIHHSSHKRCCWQTSNHSKIYSFSYRDYSTCPIDLSKHNWKVLPNTSFQDSSTLRIQRTTVPISKNRSIYLKKIILPYLRAKKIKLGYPRKQFSLIIMDTFKVQDKKETKSFCLENNCKLLPHNFTNKLQPFDLTINLKAKKFVLNQFNKWCAKRVSRQITNGKSPGDFWNWAIWNHDTPNVWLKCMNILKNKRSPSYIWNNGSGEIFPRYLHKTREPFWR